MSGPCSKAQIAIDFDGILTDLSFVAEHGLNEFNILRSPFSIAMSWPRKGIERILSVCALFSELVVLTSRPKEHRACIDSWLGQQGLAVFFSDVICCGDSPKHEFMAQHGLEVLIDDKASNIATLPTKMTGICWTEQGAGEIIVMLLDILSQRRSHLTCHPDSPLIKVEQATDTSAAPVHLLTLEDGSRYKLRVCKSRAHRSSMTAFLRVANAANYAHVACLRAASECAVLKEFVIGKPIWEVPTPQRIKTVHAIGEALARLHAIECSPSSFPVPLPHYEGQCSPLVFSADNFNVFIKPNGQIAFIDLESSSCGSRWIDVCWARHLLCNNTSEIEVFEQGYNSIYQGPPANSAVAEMAEFDFKLWLTDALKDNLLAHPIGSPKHDLVRTIIGKQWA